MKLTGTIVTFALGAAAGMYMRSTQQMRMTGQQNQQGQYGQYGQNNQQSQYSQQTQSNQQDQNNPSYVKIQQGNTAVEARLSEVENNGSGIQ